MAEQETKVPWLQGKPNFEMAGPARLRVRFRRCLPTYDDTIGLGQNLSAVITHRSNGLHSPRGEPAYHGASSHSPRWTFRLRDGVAWSPRSAVASRLRVLFVCLFSKNGASAHGQALSSL
jgi:hypothetical protein